MSEQAKSASKPKEEGDDQEFSHLAGPRTAQQPSDEQLEQPEPPIENQDNIIPGQEPEDEGVFEVQGPALEADQQEPILEDTRDQCGDGPDIMEHILSNLEPIIVPEAGEGQPYL